MKRTTGSALRPHGGYRRLRSFQVTGIIYDGTVSFCDRFVDRRSRTRDQMIQAARSGRQNIAEGSRASATSGKSELHLVNVARASLDELLLDYEDYLRQRKLPAWQKQDPQALAVRAVGRQDPTDPTDPTDPSDAYSSWLTSPDPAIVANALICLIHQANYLLDRQIASLESQFVQEGGFSERLFAARLEKRGAHVQLDSRICPSCGRSLILRTVRKGHRAGSRFWGCSGYPACKATLSSDRSDRSD